MQCTGKRKSSKDETFTYASMVLGSIAVKTIEREDFPRTKKAKLAPLKMPGNLPPLDLPPIVLSEEKRRDMVCMLAPVWALEFRASC